MKKEKTLPGNLVVLTVILIFGFLLRLSLSVYAAKGLFWDMFAYDSFAREMLSGKLVTDCCDRNVGYSAFLAIIYLIFGSSNLTVVRFINILLDLASGVLIFFSAGKMFGRKTAYISFILFISNPFTAAYTGLILPESVTLFYISLVIFVISRDNFVKSRWLWIVFGLLIGLLLFTRSQMYFFALSLPFLFSLLLFGKMQKLSFFLLFLTGFLLTSLYTFTGNYRNYKKISLIPPYSLGVGGLYTAFYLGKYPEIDTMNNLNPEYVRIIKEYIDTSNDQKNLFYDKYRQLYLEKVSREWQSYLSIVGSNMFWLWDKDHLYTYADPFYPKDSIYLRIYNLILLGLFVIGIVAFIQKEGRKSLKNPVVLFTALLFLYITFFISLVSSESRHSLPFYPLIFLWGGYGISVIYSYLKTH